LSLHHLSSLRSFPPFSHNPSQLPPASPCILRFALVSLCIVYCTSASAEIPLNCIAAHDSPFKGCVFPFSGLFLTHHGFTSHWASNPKRFLSCRSSRSLQRG
jgi:hypothetical protein